MNAEFTGDAGDSADAELILASELLEKLHFLSPGHACLLSVSEGGTVGEEVDLSKWAKSDCGNGPDHYAEIKEALIQ
jgi:hypothetical protein